MQHNSAPWQTCDDSCDDPCSPHAASFSPLSLLHASPLSPPHLSHSHSSVTDSTASVLYRRSPSSAAAVHDGFDYRSAASVSSSPSVDCYLVDDVEQHQHTDQLALPSIDFLPFRSQPDPYSYTAVVHPSPYNAPPQLHVDERMVRRKLKHKLLDSERRRRENAALHSLARLTAAPNQNTTQLLLQREAANSTALTVQSSVEKQGLKRRRVCTRSGGINITSEVVREASDCGGTEQLAKVDVLERTVVKLEEAITDNRQKDQHIASLQCQLHAALAALAKKQPMSLASNLLSAVTSDCHSSDSQYTALSPSALTFVSALDRSQSLSLYSFVRPHISLLSASLPHFRIVDVNSAHRRLTGWSDEYIVGKLMAWSLSKDVRQRSDVAAIVKKVQQRPNGDVWVQKATQYPASGVRLKELLRGETEKADMVWRMYKSDGRLYETECSFWLGGAVSVDAANEWCEAEDDISAVNDNRSKYSEMSGVEAAEKRLAGRYLIVAAAWQDAIEVST